MSHSRRKQLVLTVKKTAAGFVTPVCANARSRQSGSKTVYFEVINERCIGCGNCTIVCSQGAKVFLRTEDDLKGLLKQGRKVVAIVAPSFSGRILPTSRIIKNLSGW